MDIKNIIESWVVSNNPTEQQLKLAHLRGEICRTCELNLNIMSIHVCGGCGCPISKKIFSQKHNDCPSKLWEDVDKDYFKVKKTLM